MPVDTHSMFVRLWDLISIEPRAAESQIAECASAQARLSKAIYGGQPASPDDYDIPHVNASVQLPLLRNAAAELFPDIRFRGSAYYPPGGGISWHTNADAPGWRAYVVRAPGISYLGTATGMIQDKDRHVNLFYVAGRDRAAENWHYVMAPNERWSLGMILSDVLALELTDFVCG